MYRLHVTSVEPWFKNARKAAGPKITGENYLLVLPGMAQQDVYDVLGGPTHRDFGSNSTTTMRWERPSGRSISVVFRDEMVLSCSQRGLDSEIEQALLGP